MGRFGLWVGVVGGGIIGWEGWALVGWVGVVFVFALVFLYGQW